MVSLNQMGAMALMLVLAAVIISVGASILDELADDRCTDAGGTWAGGACPGFETTAVNASTSGLESMETFADWLPLIALVVVAAIVIGIIVTYMGGSR